MIFSELSKMVSRFVVEKADGSAAMTSTGEGGGGYVPQHVRICKYMYKCV